MPSDNSQKTTKFLIYIDEAGDPGLAKVKPIDPNGASEWLVMSAVVIRIDRERDLVDWVKNIRSAVGSRQGSTLHYRNLSLSKKCTACSELAKLPLRGFVVLSNKKNMRQHKNTNAENKYPTKQWFYNYCTRLLLERVSEFCEAMSIKEHGIPHKAKIIFSKRGGHSYRHVQTYLELLKIKHDQGQTYLPKREIKWTVIDHELIEDIPHYANAGVQLADLVASAFYQAADTSGSKWTIEPATYLLPRMASRNGIYADYGVSLQPAPPWRAGLNTDQRLIFKHFGFVF